MDRTKSLRVSIVASALGYFGLQSLIWVLVVSPSVAVMPPYVWFFASSAFLHIGIALFFLWRETDFRHTKTREPLRRVNAACHLTLFRLSCGPTLLFIAIAVDAGKASAVTLVVLAALAFLSDFFDGQVARRLNQTTDIGAYLDSSTDYAVLLVLSIAFVIIGMMPLWYFALLVVRFVGFAAAMGILSRRHGSLVAETTFLGKAAVFSAMTACAFELAGYAGLPVIGEARVVEIVEFASAAVLLVSIVDKVLYLRRRFRSG